MTRYLIDSNILFFYASDPAQLTLEIKDILKDYNNRIYVPAKCVEELIYLHQSGKIGIKQWKSAEAILEFIIDELGFGIKYIAEEHLRTLARLPLFPDHKDPTDRIIIAQAITEKTPLVSSDRKFNEYRRVGLDFVFNKR
jgi:PIN domain nuclease of toxin-antitoxin system